MPLQYIGAVVVGDVSYGSSDGKHVSDSNISYIRDKRQNVIVTF